MPINMHPPAISYDVNGVAGVTANNATEAYYGIGVLHARHRQAQALRTWSAALGTLSTALIGSIPNAPTYAIDEMAHRIDAPRLGIEAWEVMRGPERHYLQAYVDGFVAEGKRVGRPWESLMLGLLPIEQVTPAAVLSGVLFMAYHSQARGQARMEQLLLQLLQRGAAPDALRELHKPFLDEWRPESTPDSLAYGAFLGSYLGTTSPADTSGGSNAWALSGRRSHEGSSLLFSDPHMACHELPGNFFEVRVKLPNNQYWLGGTLPGMPVVVVGRNATLAWTNTHACAKTVDSSLLAVDGERKIAGADSRHDLKPESVQLGPKWAPWARREVTLWRSELGTLLQTTPSSDISPGTYLAQRWAAGQNGQQLADSLVSYMDLSECASVGEAADRMRLHQIFSFHMVYADRAGDIGYQQVGYVPERNIEGRRLLAPWVPGGAATTPPPWGANPAALPCFDSRSEKEGETAFIVRANEARSAVNGQVVAPFAQPDYRHDRIVHMLTEAPFPSLDATLQLDTLSEQGRLLAPLFISALDGTGTVARALQNWDFSCDATSVGAHAFSLAYQAALHGLSEELGGASWDDALETTEVGVWWAKPLDRLLSQANSWSEARGGRLREALLAIKDSPLAPWGEVQTIEPAHPLSGLIPSSALRRYWKLTTPSRPLPGSLATVRQGNRVPDGGARAAVAAAYRMSCDLATDEAHTSLPGSPSDPDQGAFLEAWHQGRSHVLHAPLPDEASDPAAVRPPPMNTQTQ